MIDTIVIFYMKYEQNNFEQKDIKRSIEDFFTTCKGEISKKSAISITGPAIIPHMINYDKLHYDKIHVVDNDPEVIAQIKNQSLNFNTPVILHEMDIFDAIRKIRKKEMISELDLDFPVTASTVLRGIHENIDLFRPNDSFCDKVTLTLTVCKRDQKRGHLNFFPTVTGILLGEGWGIENSWYTSYANGWHSSPMATQLWILTKDDTVRNIKSNDVFSQKWYKKKG